MYETYAEYMRTNSPEAKIKKLDATIAILKANQEKIATATKVDIVKEG